MRDYERFGIKKLRLKGFEVLFLDMTALLHPNYLSLHQPDDLVQDSNLMSVQHWRDVPRFLSAHQGFIGIDMMGLSEKNISFYTFLKSQRIPYIQFAVNTKPQPQTTSSWIKRQWESLIKMDIKSLERKWRWAIARLLDNKFRVLQPPYAVVRGGKIEVNLRPWPTTDTKIVWAHALDYDLYLDHEKSPKSVEKGKGSVVFLDEYFPFHPDYILMPEADPHLDARAYYAGLNHLFDELDRSLGLSTVIAAHPRSFYNRFPWAFPGREIVKGRTIELVANAQLVVAHSSTSINFAVLYQKPILFITSDALDQTWHGKSIDVTAKELEKKPVNVDHLQNEPWELQLPVDPQIYQRYRENYIKITGSPEMYFWEIAGDYLKGGSAL